MSSEKLANVLWSTKSVGKAMSKVVSAVKDLLRRNKTATKPPAIVVDIDETCLINESDDSDKFRVNRPVFDAVKQLVDEGCTLFAVTARTDSPATQIYARNQLERVLKYPKFEKIYAFPESRASEGTASLFKSDARRDIAADYNVLLNVGDQASDMMVMPPAAPGGDAFAKRNFKPHKCYVLTVPGDVSVMSVKLPNSYVVA